jgi:hypothetical protein
MLGNAERAIGVITLVAAALFLPACSATGRATGPSLKLAVVVEDAVNKGLPGAKVSVTIIGSRGGVFRAVAGSSGVAELEIPGDARFSISVEFQGFVPVTVGPIDAPKRDTFTFPIHLELQPSHTLVY